MSVAFSSLLCVAIIAGTEQKLDNHGQDNTIHLAPCFVFPVDALEIPAQDSGVLESMNIQLGDAVVAGQRCAQIRDEIAGIERRLAARQLEQAKIEAESDIDVRYARAVAEVAGAEHRQAVTIDTNVPGAMGESEVRRRALARERAQLAIEQAEIEQRLAQAKCQTQQAELMLAEARVALRQIVSPINGVVVQVYKRPGEWVGQGEPVLRIVRLDELVVSVYVAPSQFSPRQLYGRRVEVAVKTADGQPTQLSGKIVFCSPVLEANGQYHVQAKLTNTYRDGQWVLQPGHCVEMDARGDPMQESPQVAGNAAYSGTRPAP